MRRVYVPSPWTIELTSIWYVVPATTAPIEAAVAPAAGAVAHVTVFSAQGVPAASVTSPPRGAGSEQVRRSVAPRTVDDPTPVTVNRTRKFFTGLLSVS